MNSPIAETPGQEASEIAQRLIWAERDIARAEQRTFKTEQKLKEALAAQAKAESALRIEARKIGLLQAQLDKVYTSTSWRVSRPVRAISRVRALLLRLAGKPPAAPPPLPPPKPAVAATPQIELESREKAILQRLSGRNRS